MKAIWSKHSPENPTKAVLDCGRELASLLAKAKQTNETRKSFKDLSMQLWKSWQKLGAEYPKSKTACAEALVTAIQSQPSMMLDDNAVLIELYECVCANGISAAAASYYTLGSLHFDLEHLGLAETNLHKCWEHKSKPKGPVGREWSTYGYALAEALRKQAKDQESVLGQKSEAGDKEKEEIKVKREEAKSVMTSVWKAVKKRLSVEIFPAAEVEGALEDLQFGHSYGEFLLELQEYEAADPVLKLVWESVYQLKSDSKQEDLITKLFRAAYRYAECQTLRVKDGNFVEAERALKAKMSWDKTCGKESDEGDTQRSKDLLEEVQSEISKGQRTGRTLNAQKNAQRSRSSSQISRKKGTIKLFCTEMCLLVGGSGFIQGPGSREVDET